jgi:hypothetical protein
VPFRDPVLYEQHAAEDDRVAWWYRQNIMILENDGAKEVVGARPVGE